MSVSEHSLETLLEWSRGRWMADYREQAENIEAIALAKLKETQPTKKLKRDEETGVLSIVDDPKPEGKK